MRTLCLSIVALTAFAAPAAAQTLPSCPLASGVKDVSYAQAPDMLKQLFSKNRKFTMPGQAYDAANPDSQRLVGVKNRGNRWIVIYEQGGGDAAARIARYDISPTAVSVGPELGAKADTLCAIADRQLGLTPALPPVPAETPTPQPVSTSSP